MESEDDSLLEIKDYQGLYKRNPLVGVASLLGIASLAGVPPLGGFIAKVLIIYSGLSSQVYMVC